YLSTKKGIRPSVQHRCRHFFVSDGIPEVIFGGRAPHITDSVCRYFWRTAPHTHIVDTSAYCTYSRILYILVHTVHSRAYCTYLHTVHTRAHCPIDNGTPSPAAVEIVRVFAFCAAAIGDASGLPR